jgi:CubicO group peptidase (beta-lactamase class C family)
LRRRVLASGLVAGLCAAAVLALWARPPDLIRVGANYTAKIVCSNAFLTKRDPAEVFATDVQAPGHPLLRLMRIDVDRMHGLVRAGLFGFIGDGLAVSVPGKGCAVVPDGRLDALRKPRSTEVEPITPAAAVGTEPAIVPALQRLADDDALAGPGIRAIVVVHDGRVVAERYAPGFDRDTVQLGWSMTKSVTAGLIGLLVKDGRLRLDAPAGWTTRDGRERISIADLLSMTSGLEFNEGYGAVSDVTRMLYLEPDMDEFARVKPLIHAPGAVWSYSSGTAVMLARIFQNNALPDPRAYLRTRLFGPLGMSSAVIEADEAGNFVGSSYMYATPRDWARYGQLLVQDGVWNGEAVLPPGYVAMMSSPVAPSAGEYGRGMVWRWVTHSDTPGVNPGAAYGIPDDTFWMSGHDGQYAAIIPSRQLVIVRMGLTPSRLLYHPEPLVSAMLGAIQGDPAHAQARLASNGRAESRQ